MPSRDRFLVDELTRHADLGAACALATVVRVVGSAYRGVGARMLVRADGTTQGMVSGGCLEGDLAARAPGVIATGRPQVVTYDTRSGDDLVWGLGLGCEGAVELLLEPLPPVRARSLAAFLASAASLDRPAVIATIARVPDSLAAHVGARLLIDTSGMVVARHGEMPDALAEVARDDAREMLADGGARTRGAARDYALAWSEAAAHVALEPVAPPVRLVLCGAGPDAAPVAAQGARLGWDVVVVDHRPPSALHDARFPDARVVRCDEPARLAGVVALDARSHVVVMSHHFERDLSYLGALLASDAPYVGLLGPRSRAERMLAEHRARVGPVDAGDLARVRAPVGLDLGGDDAESVALAIVAEVQAVAHRRPAAPLSERDAPIHDGSALPAHR